MENGREYLRAAAIGAVCGMRSMSGPAIAQLHSGNASAIVLPIMALGEFVADKLPGIPSRTMLQPLTFRALAGAFSGWQIVGKNADRRIGAALGIAGALAASFICERARKAAVNATHLPDAVVALVEDGIVVAAGRVLAT
jgi:uncharacterized membrane protein